MYQVELKAATEIAIKAGEILKSYWGKAKHVKQKQFYWDLVTEADIASEAYILEALKLRFPDHQILSEEAGLLAAPHSSYQWFVDPLDGTTNFVHQYPMISVSIGLLINQIPSVGVIYNPIFEELFQASLGQGATFNGSFMHVSTVNALERSLLATGFAYDRRNEKRHNYAEFCYMTNLCQGVRRGGSAALDLAYVAAGRLDGYWERGIKPWDMAAGITLVREAGGQVTSYENGPIDITSGRILASNGHIHSLLSEDLKKVGALGIHQTTI